MANAYDGLNPFKVPRVLKMPGGVRIETLTGAETWTLKNSQWNFLDPGGSGRTITLPEEETNDGLWYMIINTADAAETLTINNDAAAAVITIGQNEGAIVACNGTAWDGASFAIQLT